VNNSLLSPELVVCKNSNYQAGAENSIQFLLVKYNLIDIRG